MMEYTLYSYFRSSSSARLRIALNLKGLGYAMIPINLLKGEQRDPDYKALNPSGTVPLLIHNQSQNFSIGQSVAALEYLEEYHPSSPKLLPQDPHSRATVRILVEIICSDTQPVTNLRILNRVKALGGDAVAWARELMEEGLAAYEAIAKGSAGKYSVGNEITMADVCLVPAVWNAQRYGVRMEEYETVMKVFERMSGEGAVMEGHWMNQPDTPEELKQGKSS